MDYDFFQDFNENNESINCEQLKIKKRTTKWKTNNQRTRNNYTDQDDFLISISNNNVSNLNKKEKDLNDVYNNLNGNINQTNSFLSVEKNNQKQLLHNLKINSTNDLTKKSEIKYNNTTLNKIIQKNNDDAPYIDNLEDLNQDELNDLLDKFNDKSYEKNNFDSYTRYCESIKKKKFHEVQKKIYNFELLSEEDDFENSLIKENIENTFRPLNIEKQLNLVCKVFDEAKKKKRNLSDKRMLYSDQISDFQKNKQYIMDQIKNSVDDFSKS